MANSNPTVVALHPVKAQTPAQRAAAYRLRKKSRVNPELSPPVCDPKPVTAPSRPAKAVTPSRPSRLAPTLLTVTSFALAAVAVAMNGVFAHGLGSTAIAGVVFCAIGVAADATALALPACAASLWQTHQRGAALAGWLIWAVTFAFTVTAGVGFASVNISDVTQARAERVTPAIELAKATLADAMTARDRECAGGVGKTCRAREEAVTDRRKNLDLAMAASGTNADPQTAAASRIVAWLSLGTVRPSGEDFATLRLILLALLPQVGGILLMIARRA